MFGPHPLRVLSCLALLAALPAQQGSESTPAWRAAAFQVNCRAGLQRLDGQLWGFSDQYKVRFDEGGPEFTPVLGRAAPRNYPMTLRLDSIRRGGTAVELRTGKPDHRGLRVEYDHGAVIERYDMLLDAVEQSFVFHERPAGSGDLIVRAQLETDMVVTADGDGLRLEQPGVGGFRIGAVTGIDGNGDRAAGNVRYQDGQLELSLPAAFVEHAALPFALDPLIGSAFGVSVGQTSDGSPRAAYDLTNDLYLVVWSTTVSTTDSDIYCQRVSRFGALVGTRIAIDATTFSYIEPDVANVDFADSFFVAFTSQGHIIGSVVAAADGSTGGKWLLVGGPANKRTPSVGGGSASALLVWDSDAEVGLLGANVHVNSGQPSLQTTHILISGSTGRASRPRISKRGPRLAVVFERQFASKDPWALVVDSSGVPMTPPVSLDGRGTNGDLVEVDGDNAHWVATWQDLAGSGNHNVVARSLSLVPLSNPNRLELGAIGFETTDTSDETAPSVIWTGGSALVGWSRYNSFPLYRTLYVRSLEPFRCTACEGTGPAFGGAGVLNSQQSGCSALSGGGSPDDALLVWTSTSVSPFNADIFARLWRSTDGGVTQVFPACGNGGSALAPCVRVPSPDFTHRLRAATPNAPTFLLQSLGRGDFACASCLLVPAIGTAVSLFGVTDGVGNCAFGSPIPDDPGLRGLVQFEQWLTLRPGAPCPLYAIDLSSALRVVIE